MRRTTVVLAAVCALAGVGCANESSPRSAPSASGSIPASDSPTPTPSPTPAEATFTYGEVVYSDDFSDKSKGWTEKNTDQVAYTVHDDYALPLYSVQVKAPNLHVFPRPEFRGVTRDQLADYEVRAKLQTTLSVGHTDLFGVTCRDLNNERYSLSIGYDLRRTGQIPWRIVRHTPDGTRVLGEGSAPAPGGSAFDVAGTCAGGKDGGPANLVLTVNGTEVGRAQDTESPLTEGLAGVYVLTDDGKTTINVIQFSVRSATVA